MYCVFFLVVINLSFLPATFVKKSVSFNFEKEKHPCNTLCNSRKPFLISKYCRLHFIWFIYKKTLGFLDLSLYPLKFHRKWAFTAANFKARSLKTQDSSEIPHEFFLNTPGNSHGLSSVPLEILCPQPPSRHTHTHTHTHTQIQLPVLIFSGTVLSAKPVTCVARSKVKHFLIYCTLILITFSLLTT